MDIIKQLKMMKPKKKEAGAIPLEGKGNARKVRMNIAVSPQFKKDLTKAVDISGESMTGFIIESVKQRIERMAEDKRVTNE